MLTKTQNTREPETAERPVRQTPFGAPHVFVLAVVEGDDVGAVYRIGQRETLIGRGVEAGIALDSDESVSKRHCLVRVDGGVCTLVDLESTNGTMLNGRVLEGVAGRLRHLDEITIGRTRLMLLSGKFKNASDAD